MRIFGWEITKQKKPKEEESYESSKRMAGTILLPWEHKREIYAPENFQRYIDAYNSWVAICSTHNSNAVANAPMKLYVGKQKKDAKLIVKTAKIDRKIEQRLRSQANLLSYHRKSVEMEEVLDHPFLDMLKTVNPLMSRFDLWDATQLWLELTGNAYWYVYKDKMGIPKEIWPLPPQYVTIIGDREKIIAGYVYQRTTEKVPFTEDEIVHFKFYSPTGSLYGVGPLAAVMSAYIDDRSIKSFESTLMKNLGRPEAVLQSKEVLSDSEFKRLSQRWKQRFGGANKVGQTLILEGGLEYKPITFSPREMNYTTGRKMNRDEIAAAFGVPISKLTVEAVNLANAYVGEHQYMQDTIEPRLRRIEETLNEKLLPMYDENLFVAYDNVVPEDRDFELRERTSHLGSYVTTINEEREKIGLDKVEWGDKPWAQSSVVPIGEKPEQQLQVPMGGGMPMLGATPAAEGGQELPNEPGVDALDAAATEEDLSAMSDEELDAAIAALESEVGTE